MILALVLLPLLAATPDGGVPPEPVLEVDDLRAHDYCPPPGYWDAKSKSCRPGCGIPIYWENGVRTGGCGGDRELLLREASKRPVPRKQLLPPIRDGG